MITWIIFMTFRVISGNSYGVDEVKDRIVEDETFRIKLLSDTPNRFRILAQTKCQDHRNYDSKSGKAMYTGYHGKEKINISEESIDFCPVFKFHYTDTWFVCKYYPMIDKKKKIYETRHGNGYIYDVIGLSGPLKDLIIMGDTVLTSWSHTGFRRMVKDAYNCYNEINYGDDYNYRSYITPIHNDRTVLMRTVGYRLEEYCIFTNIEDYKASDVYEIIDEVAKLFPELRKMCSTNCTADVGKL